MLLKLVMDYPSSASFFSSRPPNMGTATAESPKMKVRRKAIGDCLPSLLTIFFKPINPKITPKAPQIPIQSPN